MEATIRVYSHLTCPTSYRLFKRLRNSGALDRITLIDTGIDPFGALSHGVVSVPAIFYGDTMIYSGYFDVDEASSVIATGSLPSIEDFDYDEASVRTMEGLLDSYATALWIFLTDRIDSPLKMRSFIEAVSRHVFYRYRSGESYERLRKEVMDLYNSEKGLYIERLREIVARNIVREAMWLKRDPLYLEKLDEGYVEHLLLARVAMGRIGLFMGYGSEKIYVERVRDLQRYLVERWRDIVESVSKEVNRILGDEEYIRSYAKKLSAASTA